MCANVKTLTVSTKRPETTYHKQGTACLKRAAKNSFYIHGTPLLVK